MIPTKLGSVFANTAEFIFGTILPAKKGVGFGQFVSILAMGARTGRNRFAYRFLSFLVLPLLVVKPALTAPSSDFFAFREANCRVLFGELMPPRTMRFQGIDVGCGVRSMRVLSWGNNLKMARVDAKRIVASVVNVHSLGNICLHKKENSPVGMMRSAFEAADSIAICIFGSIPKYAFVGVGACDSFKSCTVSMSHIGNIIAHKGDI